jgi:DNA-binding IclR family transcriptional regulator
MAQQRGEPRGAGAGSGESRPGDARVLTLEKGLRILEAVASQRRGVTLTELARLLDVSKSTVHRFLATLQEVGYVERFEGGDRYRPGIKTLALAGSFLDTLAIRDAAAFYLADLALRTGETAHLGLLTGSEIVLIDTAETPNCLRVHSSVGMRLPAHSTAGGKAMLAFLPESQLRPVIAGGLPRRTSRTLVSDATLRARLAEVRSTGYAIEDEEETEGVRGVAAPVFDFDRRVAGAIGVSAPAVRMSIEKAHALAPAVGEAAEQVSRRLGYRLGAAGG